MMVSAASGAVIALLAIPGARVTVGASGTDAVLDGIARGLVVAIPVAVGLYALGRPAQARFGRLLLVLSGTWFLALLSTSSSALLYSVGRVWGWIAEVLLVYAVLAFPTGRLTTRVDRALPAITAGAAALLFLPTAFPVEQYPVPAPFMSCDVHCPRNVFMVTGHEPAFVGQFVRPVRELVLVFVFLMVAVRLTERIRAANTLMRRTLTPVLVASIAWLVLLAAGNLIRRISPTSAATHVAAWLLAFAVPAIALAFVVGIARWHLFVTDAMQTVTARVRGVPEPRRVREVLSEAFEDPALQIGRWLRKRRRWVTADGHPLDAPAAGSSRYLTEVRDGERRVAAIVHDVALRDEPAFIDTAGSLAAIAFGNERMEGRIARMLRELRESRARLLAAADGERRRIARDLHDGAQQRLVALRIELELAAEKAEQDNAGGAATLRDFGAEIEDALEEFRSLTRGIYPAILTDRGIADAVRAAALRSPISTAVETDGLRDYPREIAAAVYFCCMEALQNVAKHAREATKTRIILREADSILSFSVSDNGAGFADDSARSGAGMVNMRDRISAVGGELTVHSSPGGGTRVVGRIPLSPNEPAATRRGDLASSQARHAARQRDDSEPSSP